MGKFGQIFQQDSEAIIFKNEILKYPELQKRILSAANYLFDKNIRENDKVIILGSNSSDFVILILALWKIGAVPVPLNFNLNENELNSLIDIISPDTVLVDKVLKDLPQLLNHNCINYPFEFYNNEGDTKFQSDSNSEKTALIIFTSGSSAKPKGVKLSFNNLFKTAKEQNKFLGLNRNDKYLASLHFYHIGGFSIIIRTLLSGGTIVIPNSLKINDTNDAINKYHPTSISLVPIQLKRMIEKDFTQPEYLKNVLLGGSFIENNLVAAAINKKWKLIKVYGSSETCSFISAKRITSGNNISNSLGKVIGKNEIKIIDGHIAVKGESIMKGYLNQPAYLTEEGFFITEDIGYFNKNNELIIEGRRDDILISGGENISLKEIENYVKNFKRIKDAVVLGLEDDEWGEIITVVAVTFGNDLFPLTDLNEFLSKNVAKFKLPKKIFFIDEIPRNEMGKVMREELKKIITL